MANDESILVDLDDHGQPVCLIYGSGKGIEADGVRTRRYVPAPAQPAEPPAAETEAERQLAETHEQIAQMCEYLGSKRDEVPCDAWHLRDLIVKLSAKVGVAAETDALPTLGGAILDDAQARIDAHKAAGMEHVPLTVGSAEWMLGRARAAIAPSKPAAETDACRHANQRQARPVMRDPVLWCDDCGAVEQEDGWWRLPVLTPSKPPEPVVCNQCKRAVWTAEELEEVDREATELYRRLNPPAEPAEPAIAAEHAAALSALSAAMPESAQHGLAYLAGKARSIIEGTRGGAERGGWARTSERVPEDGADVLVYSGAVREFGIAGFRGGVWKEDLSGLVLMGGGLEVTHWMPLPSPPAADSKDGVK